MQGHVLKVEYVWHCWLVCTLLVITLWGVLLGRRRWLHWDPALVAGYLLWLGDILWEKERTKDGTWVESWFCFLLVHNKLFNVSARFLIPSFFHLKMLNVLLCWSLSYYLDTGSLTEPVAELARSKPEHSVLFSAFSPVPSAAIRGTAEATPSFFKLRVQDFELGSSYLLSYLPCPLCFSHSAVSKLACLIENIPAACAQLCLTFTGHLHLHRE